MQEMQAFLKMKENITKKSFSSRSKYLVTPFGKFSSVPEAIKSGKTELTRDVLGRFATNSEHPDYYFVEK